MIIDLFLVEKWGTSAQGRLQKIIKLDSQDSICFAFFKLLKDEETFWKSFSFTFFAKCFFAKLQMFLIFSIS